MRFHYLIAVIIPCLPLTKACGGFFCQLAQPVLQSGEAIVFGVEGNNVTMHVQILYEGPAEAFSWVLPVPFQPQVDVGSDRIFTALFQATLPTFQLDIQEVDTETCSEDDFQPKSECPPVALMSESAPMSTSTPAADADAAVVLEQGSVGPFDFVILEAADKDPSSVFRWLEDNGYDQPDESAALLTHYATNDHKFVALRLQKQAETGEIQPLILKYQMPSNDDAPSPIACIPIQLTRIAATDNMPIQVYVFGNTRASPLNFIEMELDDAQVPWLACQNNPTCFDDNYRQRFHHAADELVNHTFVTEYAGPANITQGLIMIPISAEDIASVATEQEFFERYYFLLSNTVPLVDIIVAEHTSTFLEGSELKDENWLFNATLLAQELDEKVLQPAMKDQAYVDSFAYLTRLYARLSPEAMTKDPFFAFKEDLPDIDQVHRATALPICVDSVPTALEITVEKGGATVTVSAAFDPCGFNRWTPAADTVIVNSVSPALRLASWGFSTDPGIVVLRSDNGTFDMQAVEEAIAFGDSLVMSQAIPGANGNTTAPGTTTTPPGSSMPPTIPSSSIPQPPSAVGVTEPPVLDNIFSNKSETPTPAPIPTTSPASGTSSDRTSRKESLRSFAAQVVVMFALVLI
jgi:hypothetical protein